MNYSPIREFFYNCRRNVNFVVGFLMILSLENRVAHNLKHTSINVRLQLLNNKIHGFFGVAFSKFSDLSACLKESLERGLFR